jgi:hypothetical protein
MDKKEKYYDYIIKDLLRKTAFDYYDLSDNRGTNVNVVIPTEFGNADYAEFFADGGGYGSTPVEMEKLDKILDWFNGELEGYEIDYMQTWYGLREEEMKPILIEYMKQLAEKIKKSFDER